MNEVEMIIEIAHPKTGKAMDVRVDFLPSEQFIILDIRLKGKNIDIIDLPKNWEKEVFEAANLKFAECAAYLFEQMAEGIKNDYDLNSEES